MYFKWGFLHHFIWMCSIAKIVHKPWPVRYHGVGSSELCHLFPTLVAVPAHPVLFPEICLSQALRNSVQWICAFWKLFELTESVISTEINLSRAFSSVLHLFYALFRYLWLQVTNPINLSRKKKSGGGGAGGWEERRRKMVMMYYLFVIEI